MPKKKPESQSDNPEVAEKPEAQAGVFDVSKPGSTPASPTSRPIIVGHQTTLKQDPILTKDESETEAEKSTSTTTLTKQKKIVPLSAEEKGEAAATDSDEKSVKDEKSAAETTDTTDPNAAIDALASEVDAKAQAKEQSKADIERDAKVQALIDAKQYHLPITEGGKKAASERVATWLLIFMLLAAAGAWLAVDGGFLDIGIELPYDLIKN